MKPGSFEAAAVCALWNSGDRGDWYLVKNPLGNLLTSRSDYWACLWVVIHPDGTVEPDPSPTRF